MDINNIMFRNNSMDSTSSIDSNLGNMSFDVSDDNSSYMNIDDLNKNNNNSNNVSIGGGVTSGGSGGFVDIFSYPGVLEVFIAVYSMLWLFCVVGNVLVLTVLTRSYTQRTLTNLFLRHLAVADLSVGLICIIPNLLVAKFFVWVPGLIGTFLCKLYNFFEEFSMTVSVLLLVLIAAERYVAIIYPLKSRRFFTRRKMYAALTMVWLASCLYNIPLMMVYTTTTIPKFPNRPKTLPTSLVNTNGSSNNIISGTNSDSTNNIIVSNGTTTWSGINNSNSSAIIPINGNDNIATNGSSITNFNKGDNNNFAPITETYCYRVRDNPEKMCTYVTFSFALTYVLPLLLMIVMYVRISLTLWRSSPANLLQSPDTKAGRTITHDANASEVNNLKEPLQSLQSDNFSMTSRKHGSSLSSAFHNEMEATSNKPFGRSAATIKHNSARSVTSSCRSQDVENRGGRSSCTSCSSVSGSGSTSNTTVSDYDNLPAVTTGYCCHDNGVISRARAPLTFTRSDPNGRLDPDLVNFALEVTRLGGMAEANSTKHVRSLSWRRQRGGDNDGDGEGRGGGGRGVGVSVSRTESTQPLLSSPTSITSPLSPLSPSSPLSFLLFSALTPLDPSPSPSSVPSMPLSKTANRPLHDHHYPHYQHHAGSTSAPNRACSVSCSGLQPGGHSSARAAPTSGSSRSRANDSACATFASSASRAAATSGSRDGVYLLRPGQGEGRKTSCRLRIKLHHALEARRRAIRLLVVVLLTFALLVLPFHLRVLVRYCYDPNVFLGTGLPKYITQVLFFLNSALNPVLYSLMSDSFRRSAREVLCCSRRDRRAKDTANFGAREARDHHKTLNRLTAARNTH